MICARNAASRTPLYSSYFGLQYIIIRSLNEISRMSLYMFVQHPHLYIPIPAPLLWSFIHSFSTPTSAQYVHSYVPFTATEHC
jgi:hypothetical protein